MPKKLRWKRDPAPVYIHRPRSWTLWYGGDEVAGVYPESGPNRSWGWRYRTDGLFGVPRANNVALFATDEAAKEACDAFVAEHFDAKASLTLSMPVRLPVVLEPSRTGWGIHCPAIPGCVSTGATVDEAYKNFREALGLHLEGTEEDG